MILIKPYDPGSVGDIAKGIQASELGITPQVDGKVIRLSIPPLSEERRRIVHRAWAEYWGSRSPEPGTAEHEHLVYHLLRSNAHRQAVRMGLESARFWTARHQAQKARGVLEVVSRSVY